jgi:hypothetical protein
MKFLIGSDPELFLKDENNNIASVIGLIGGTKYEPMNIGNECSIQEDNILAEFNIPPVNTFNHFLSSIEYCKSYISTLIASKGLSLHYSSSEMINELILLEPEAQLMGCSPSINIITKTESHLQAWEIPKELQNLRTSGFHIHFGYNEPNEEFNSRLVLCFEICTTLPLVSFDHDPFDRRQFYGKFGDCRFKDYGVECRSLGGYFLKDPDTIKKVWEGIENTMALFNSKISTKELEEMVSFCIGEDDKPILTHINKVTTDITSNKLITIK